MVALLSAMDAAHPAEAVLVLSNESSAGGLSKAIDMGVRTEVVDHRIFKSREQFEKEINSRLRATCVDLVCLAGFMRILTPSFLKEWEGRCLNIHPSLLPNFRGLNTHSRAIEAGACEHGCTVHEVTTDLDEGPILGQARLTVAPDDTPRSLASRVLALEHVLYPAVLRRYATGDQRPIFMG